MRLIRTVTGRRAEAHKDGDRGDLPPAGRVIELPGRGCSARPKSNRACARVPDVAPLIRMSDFHCKEKSKNTSPSVTLADDMADDDDKPAPIPFVVDVTVDRTRVQVTLLLKPGTAVTVAETKTTTEPEPPKAA